jgi:BASS family bile acid:Na+ symporter
MPWAARLHHAIQKRLLWVLLAAYGLSAVAPAPGLAMRAASLGRLAVGGVSLDLSAPAMLLGILLFNSSLNLSAPAVRTLLGQPRLVIWGLIANTLLPLAFALLASWSLTAWHNSDEIQNLLVALAIVGSMPIAGSSTAWAQNAEGNVALSMGLIMGSTLTAPLTTPLVLSRRCLRRPTWTTWPSSAPWRARCAPRPSSPAGSWDDRCGRNRPNACLCCSV